MLDDNDFNIMLNDDNDDDVIGSGSLIFRMSPPENADDTWVHDDGAVGEEEGEEEKVSSSSAKIIGATTTTTWFQPPPPSEKQQEQREKELDDLPYCYSNKRISSSKFNAVSSNMLMDRTWASSLLCRRQQQQQLADDDDDNPLPVMVSAAATTTTTEECKRGHQEVPASTRYIQPHRNDEYSVNYEVETWSKPKKTKNLVHPPCTETKRARSPSSIIEPLNWVNQRCPLDVLMGRGTRSNQNLGNPLFLQAKDEMQERYKSSPKNEKTMISKELVKKVASSSIIQPLNWVNQRCPLDVLMGRGTRSNQNLGNRLFLQAKDEMQGRYKSATKNEKTMISKELVKKVASWGGRFIKLGSDRTNGEDLERWYEVSSKVALRKASQALRDINTAEFRDCKRRKYKK